jgi:hypothetical protein
MIPPEVKKRQDNKKGVLEEEANNPKEGTKPMRRGGLPDRVGRSRKPAWCYASSSGLRPVTETHVKAQASGSFTCCLLGALTVQLLLPAQSLILGRDAVFCVLWCSPCDRKRGLSYLQLGTCLPVSLSPLAPRKISPWKGWEFTGCLLSSHGRK